MDFLPASPRLRDARLSRVAVATIPLLFIPPTGSTYFESTSGSFFEVPRVVTSAIPSNRSDALFGARFDIETAVKPARVVSERVVVKNEWLERSSGDVPRRHLSPARRPNFPRENQVAAVKSLYRCLLRSRLEHCGLHVPFDLIESLAY